jgi:hypothetical protein
MLYAVLALVAFLWWKQHEAALRNEGALRSEIAGLTARNAKLEGEAGRIDTVYRTDTITLRKVRTVTDSLLITDTVIHTDTVRAILATERAACNAVISTCEQAKANLRSQVAVLDSIIAAERKNRPSWLSKVITKATWASIGYAAGSILHK